MAKKSSPWPTWLTGTANGIVFGISPKTNRTDWAARPAIVAQICMNRHLIDRCKRVKCRAPGKRPWAKVRYGWVIDLPNANVIPSPSICRRERSRSCVPHFGCQAGDIISGTYTNLASPLPYTIYLCPLPPIPPGCHCFKLESPFQFLFLLLLLVVIAISQSRSLKGGSTNWFDNRKGRVGRTAVLPSSNRPDFTTTPPPGDNTQHVPPMKILFGQGIQHVSMPCRWSTIVRPHVCQLDFAFSNKLMKVLPFSVHAYCQSNTNYSLYVK